MRWLLAVMVVTLLASPAAAQQSGLSGAIERQRQDMKTQQGDIRRETERQGGNLQQQQDRNLQFQLLQRQQPTPQPVTPNCVQIRGTFGCQ
jgi:hypothetical protein